MNENAKVPAFWNTQPELCHNEVSGWGQHGDVTRQVITLVGLRHDFEHPQVMHRFELTYRLLDEVVAGIEEVQAEGEGELAQLLDLILVGDVTSIQLALQEGVDPGPIPAQDQIKHALATSAGERTDEKITQPGREHPPMTDSTPTPPATSPTPPWPSSAASASRGPTATCRCWPASGPASRRSARWRASPSPPASTSPPRRPTCCAR